MSITDNSGSVLAYVDGSAVTVSPDGNLQFTADENRNYRITAADPSGNQAERLVTVSGIDKTGPAIQIAVPPAEGWAKSKSFSFTVSDLDSGVARVTVDGAPCSADGSGIYTYSDQREGLHTVAIVASDLAGNESSASVTVGQIDVTPPPTPALTQTVNGVQRTVSASYTASGLSFQVSGAAAASGTQSAVQVYYRSSSSLFAGGTANTWNAWPSAAGAASPLTLPANASESNAVYTIELKTVDSAGNESASVSYQITVPGKKAESKVEKPSSSSRPESSSSKIESSSSAPVPEISSTPEPEQSSATETTSSDDTSSSSAGEESSPPVE